MRYIQIVYKCVKYKYEAIYTQNQLQNKIFRHLKGQFGLFDVELYEVLISHQCIFLSRWWSAHSLFEEAQKLNN